MIDISFERHNSAKAHVYLDGPDARLFRRLKEKLGSDESTQNAIILEGLIKKLELSHNTKKAEAIKLLFPKVVGLSYAQLQKITCSN